MSLLLSGESLVSHMEITNCIKEKPFSNPAAFVFDPQCDSLCDCEETCYGYMAYMVHVPKLPKCNTPFSVACFTLIGHLFTDIFNFT